ncbi:deoxyribonuclease IV [Fontisphaera persica]|uniref:deoxyribonuclease IV n=1 Tax=Fontisphaera persica TaxID=2974023 RepID=UPI0024C0241A|nr:deoxyribonuclease IV [Fontisphaera persica]WCJ59379.1 deoxyribonuclease IV [Fontisphaera persica]
MKLGAHMSTSGGVHRALERGLGIGCEIVQLFVKNNMQWFGRPYPPQDLARFAQLAAAGQLSAIFGHTGYLINIAAPASPNRDRSLQSLTQEIQLAESLGLPFLVLHPGAHLGHGETTGLRQAAAALDEVFQATPHSPVRIALENTAGQGTCLGHRLEHLFELYALVKHPQRLAVCLDTAHFFAAGYDLRYPKVWDALIAECERRLGLDQLLAFHLNDSKSPLGSRVDRHAGIGQGAMGRDAFRHIVNDPRFRDRPGCLETPKSEDLHEDVENLAILRSLMEPPPPTARRRRKPAQPALGKSPKPAHIKPQLTS